MSIPIHPSVKDHQLFALIQNSKRSLIVDKRGRRYLVAPLVAMELHFPRNLALRFRDTWK